MEKDTLQKYIQAHQTKLPTLFAKEAYSIGKHPAINSAPAKASPDYRISVPLIRSAIDQTAGFMAKPGNVTYQGDVYENTLKPIYDDNEESLITQQAFKNACTYGEAWEIHWFENQEPMFALIPATQAIPVWTNTLKPKLEALIWWRKVDEDEIATVYDDEKVTTYDVTNGYTVIGEESHGYRAVPAVRFRIDMAGRNLFDHVLPMCDALDRAASHSLANESEKLADAIMLFRDKINDEDKDDIKNWSFIDGLNEDVSKAAMYLTKNLPHEYTQMLIKTFHDWIYQGLQIPNPGESQSGTPSSGFALVVKNMSFDNLCASMEGAFIRGLQDRIRLICGHVLINVDGTEVIVKMHRNMPFDLESMANVSAKLMGVWDNESILNLAPASVLSDEDKQRILKQKKADKEDAAALFDNQETEPVDNEEPNQE